MVVNIGNNIIGREIRRFPNCSIPTAGTKKKKNQTPCKPLSLKTEDGFRMDMNSDTAGLSQLCSKISSCLGFFIDKFTNTNADLTLHSPSLALQYSAFTSFFDLKIKTLKTYCSYG